MKNKYLRIWREPLVRMLIITAIVGTIGASMYNIVLVQYASKLAHSDLAVLLASIAGTVPYLLQTIPGKFADKTTDKMKMLFISSMVQGVLFLILSVLVTKQNWYLLIIVMVIHIVADSLELYNSGLVAVLQQRHVPGDLMETTTGLIRASSLIISIGGQSLGVMILTMTNYNFSILALINAATFFLVAFIVKINQVPPMDLKSHPASPADSDQEPEESTPSAAPQIKFWDLMAQIFLVKPRLFVTAAFIGNFLGSALVPLLNVGLLHQANRSYSYPVSVLIVSVIITLGNLLGSFFADVMFKHSTIITISVMSNTILAIFFISFFVLQWENISYGLLFAFTLISGSSNIKISSAIMKKVPSTQLASFYTSYSSLMYLSMPIGMMVVPAIALLGNGMAAVILVSLTIMMILTLLASRFFYIEAKTVKD